MFNELKPLCIDLSRLSFQPREIYDPESIPLRDALKRLEEKLASYREGISTRLADYIFIPLSSLLKHDTLGKSQTNYVLLIIAHLLRLAWRVKGTFEKEHAQQLLPLITFLISPNKQDGLLEGSSEFDRKAGSLVLFEFVSSLSRQSYRGEFFSAKDVVRLNILAHSISILLAIYEQSLQDIETQLIALDTLRILYQEVICDGELLSHILPGNVSSFCKVITSPGLHANYKVIVKTLEVMKGLLLIIYDDASLNASQHLLKNLKQLKTLKDIDGSSSFGSVEVCDLSLDESNLHRSTSWLRATSAQVNLALEKITPKLYKRNNKEISESLVDFSSAVLGRCSNSLHSCEAVLVNVLTMSKMDPKYQLASHVTCLREIVARGFDKLQHNIQFEDQDALESLNFALTSLRDVASKDDLYLIEEACLAYQGSLQTFLEVKGLNQRQRPILEQSSQVLLQDAFNQEGIREQEAPEFFSGMSKTIELSLGRILVTLGSFACKSNQLTSLVKGILSSQTCEGGTEKTIALWVASWLAVGLTESRLIFEAEYLNINADTTLDSEGCYDILEFSNDLAQEMTLSTEGTGLTPQSERTMLVVLQSIESMCNILKDDFSLELMDYLYIVVENLGSPSPKVRFMAQSCALTISHHLYNDSLKQLILENVDYLADSISSRLNAGMTERVSTVFMVICKIAGYGTIESFKDIIETIFKLLDYYHGYDDMCLQFFQLFEVIVLEIRKTYLLDGQSQEAPTLKISQGQNDVSWAMTSLDQVLASMDKDRVSDSDETDATQEINQPKNFQEYFDSRLREIDSDDEDQQEIGEEFDSTTVAEPEDSEGDKWVSPIPRNSYRVLLQVLGYGDRLLTHRSKPLRVQILHTIKLILPMLATQHDSFLPQVAQLWNALVLCSLDKDYSIVKPACDCLQETIICAGDFTTTRFLELWKTWSDKSELLKEVRIDTSKSPNNFSSLVPHKKFPTITRIAITSLSQVLLAGIRIAGLNLPDVTTREMVVCCLHVLPAEVLSSKSLMLGDIVYAISQEV